MLFSGRVSGIWPYDFGTYDLRTPGLGLKSVGDFGLEVGAMAPGFPRIENLSYPKMTVEQDRIRQRDILGSLAFVNVTLPSLGSAFRAPERKRG